jgi:hypothetical protein
VTGGARLSAFLPRPSEGQEVERRFSKTDIPPGDQRFESPFLRHGVCLTGSSMAAGVKAGLSGGAQDREIRRDRHAGHVP